ncbi:MAG: ATP-binding cassette domain-containing protein [bacterium]
MIKLKNVTVCFDDRTIIDHQTFDFPDTGVIGIKGQSGCGKTTLLYAISGLIGLKEGTILINDHPVSQDDLRDHISFMKQNQDLLEELTIYDNITAGCFFSETYYQKSDVTRLMSSLGIAHLARSYPHMCSMGQIKRAALARCLLKKADILLCDEPTGALHRQQAKEVMQLLKQYAASRLVIVVSHDEELLQEYADAIVTLKDGILTADQMTFSPGTPIVKKRHRYAYWPYAWKVLNRQKSKLFFMALFQIIVVTSFLLMGSGLMSLNQAIDHAESQAVMKNIITVEAKDERAVTLTGENVRKQYLYSGTFQPDLKNTVCYTMPRELSHIRLSSGRLPLSEEEILVSMAVYEALKGERQLVYQVNHETFHLMITGVLANDFFHEKQIFFTTAFTYAHPDGFNPYVFEVESQKPRETLKRLSLTYDVHSDVLMASESYHHLIVLARLTGGILFVVSLVSTLILLIVVFSALFMERQMSFALMLSMGARNGQLKRMSLMEAGLIATVIYLLSLIFHGLTLETINSLTPFVKTYHFTLQMIRYAFIGDLYGLIGLGYVFMVMMVSLLPYAAIRKFSVVSLLREDD